MFMNSGNNLFLTSVSARHVTRVCTVESVIDALHRVHARADVVLLVSHCTVSVMRSQVRNLRCKRSFLLSCVVWIFWRAGWGRPDKPLSCTFRNLIFEFSSDILLWFLSCQIVILVFIRVSHRDFVHAGVCRRERGGGSPYF